MTVTFTAHTCFEASGFPALEPRWRVFWYQWGEYGPELQEWNESGTSSVSPPIPFEHFGPVLAVVNCGTSEAIMGYFQENTFLGHS